MTQDLNRQPVENAKLLLVPPLSKAFLDQFVSELDDDELLGIGIGGSYVRGEATRYSDVDLLCFLRDGVDLPPKRYIFRDGRLVGIAYRTVAKVKQDMAQPQSAIYVIPMMRELSILLDKDGSIENLRQQALRFSWKTIQEQANKFVNLDMMRNNEEVHKLLGILSRSDALAFSSAMTTFPLHLTRTIAIGRGILVTTDNRLYYQVREAIGFTSAWTRAHIQAVEFSPLSPDISHLRWFGSAFLVLYQETAKLLLPSMQSNNQEILKQTLQLIKNSGFILM